MVRNRVRNEDDETNPDEEEKVKTKTKKSKKKEKSEFVGSLMNVFGQSSSWLKKSKCFNQNKFQNLQRYKKFFYDDMLF